MAAILTDLARELLRIANAVSHVGAVVPFAGVGGLAVSARTEPRFTRDADVAVPVDGDAGAEALLLRLSHAGYMVLAVIEHRTGRMSTARRIPPAGSADRVLVDLVFASNDAQELLPLLREADSVELDRCRELCGGITERGFDRGRDLAAGLGELVSRAAR